MYTLVFNGEFQLKYPNEFLADLEELKKKHNCEFFGKPILRDIGEYVDFQKVEPVDVKSETNNESTSELKQETSEEV